MIKKILLFDLDWTLIYTGGAGVRALTHAFEALFRVPEAMKIVTPDGKTDPAICREMIKVHLKRDPQDGEIDRLCRGYLDRLKIEVPIAAGYKILPGIPALLETLATQTDILMGLGTGNLEEGARIKLGRADLMRYFRFGGFASDSETRSEMLRIGSERGQKLAGRSFAPKDIVVIGDNIRDVQAGKAIGATTVAVATGPMSHAELAATSPDFLFHDLSDTPTVLRQLIG